MRKTVLFTLMLLVGGISLAQERVHQAIIANGETFEGGPVFADRANVASYDPITGSYTVFDTIHVESVQSVLVTDTLIFVAATDSLVAYHLDNHVRVATVYMPGVQRMERYEDKLIVSRGFGADSTYLELLDLEDFSLITSFVEVDDEAAGITIVGDSAYVAVPGNWMSTVGRIAVIDLAGEAFGRWIELDTLGAGIGNLYNNGTSVVSVNSIAWNASYGAVTVVDVASGAATTTKIGTTIGGGAGLSADTLFATFGNGIGTYNINTNMVMDTVAIGEGRYFVRTAMHATNGVFYGTESDFNTYGATYIYNRAGQLLDTLATGIAPEGLALDIRSGNARPYAVADAFFSPGGTTEFFDVLANDFDPNGDALTAEITVGFLQGPSSVLANQQVEYTPFAQFMGVDFMQYSICDGEYCDTARVDVVVDQPFGISPVQLVAEQVVAFPVPADEFVLVQHLAGERLGTIQLFDLAGNVVRQAAPTADRYRINVADLAAGVYVLAVEQGGSAAHQRIIKR